MPAASAHDLAFLGDLDALSELVSCFHDHHYHHPHHQGRHHHHHHEDHDVHPDLIIINIIIIIITILSIRVADRVSVERVSCVNSDSAADHTITMTTSNIIIIIIIIPFREASIVCHS
jgi:hypothetical protein